MPKELQDAEIDDREIARIEAIICSMTPAERRDPTLINGSRRVRIAEGSGVTTSDVNGLLKQFKMVQQMMQSARQGQDAASSRAASCRLPSPSRGSPVRAIGYDSHRTRRYPCSRPCVPDERNAAPWP